MKVRGKSPQINPKTFIAKSADIIGDVVIEEGASIWFQAVLRGDVMPIYVGKNSNVQDGSVIHGSFNKAQTIIKENVTVGHKVILHGCTIEPYSLIGMGSIVMDNAVIPKYSIVGAGSLVTENAKFEEGMLILGRPAKQIRKLTEEEKKGLEKSAEHYVNVCSWYIDGSEKIPGY
jgi:carbonic anhydrase/acetyltransferase-like protein (isoleucine patch superfamily)